MKKFILFTVLIFSMLEYSQAQTQVQRKSAEPAEIKAIDVNNPPKFKKDGKTTSLKKVNEKAPAKRLEENDNPEIKKQRAVKSSK